MGTEDDDWDLQAAEYVLGALSEQDQKVYDALYRVDDEWKRRVHRWQARLDPLNTSTPSIEPPSHVLTTVMARINEELSIKTSSRSTAIASAQETAPLDDPKRAPADPVDSGERKAKVYDSELSRSARASLKQWKERVRYWQFATVLAIASAVGILFLTPRYLAQRLQSDDVVRTVAVLQSESDGPLWAVSYYPDPKAVTTSASSSGFVSITAVGNPQLSAQQSHQLWMVLPQGAGVQSVGLVPDRQGETVTLELPITLDEADEFAVSLEPLGGVPGPEHGPVVARTFIIKVPESMGS